METAGILKTVSRDWQSGKFLLIFEVEGDITRQLEGIREQRLSIAARRFRKKRSLDANAYYWQLLSRLAVCRDLQEPGAQPYAAALWADGDGRWPDDLCGGAG